MTETTACACMGPQGGEPLCPCRMREAREYLDRPPFPITLKDAVISAARAYVEYPGVIGWNGKSLKDAFLELDEFNGRQ